MCWEPHGLQLFKVSVDPWCDRFACGTWKTYTGKTLQRTPQPNPTCYYWDLCNATGYLVSLDNTKVLTRDPQWTKIKVKEAIYITKHHEPWTVIPTASRLRPASWAISASQNVTWPKLLPEKSKCCDRVSKIDSKWIKIALTVNMTTVLDWLVRLHPACLIVTVCPHLVVVL